MGNYPSLILLHIIYTSKYEHIWMCNANSLPLPDIWMWRPEKY